jgi:hypothetical protein
VPPTNASLHESAVQTPVIQAAWKPEPAKTTLPKPAKFKAHPHASTKHSIVAREFAEYTEAATALRPVHIVDRELAPAPQVLLFVVQTQQADASGMIWNVSYVRWVIYHPPVEHATAVGAPAKT